MTSRRSTRPAFLSHLLAGVLVIAVATAVLPAGAASAKIKRPAPQAPISSEFFGVHHLGLHADGPIGWPQGPVGSVRMWDNRVSWREVETAPGVFDWTLIDAEMAKARANGASVLLVLGQTPVFHSTRPTAPGTYGLGASAMPTQAAWVRYVQETARRNLTVWGHVAQFQVWNEANVTGYWTGTAKQMATLTAWTRSALRAVDPSARLVAPALVTRLSSQQTWIKSFYSQKVAKKNVSAYVDALSFQLYPMANGSPEASMVLLASVRKILAKYKVVKPIWNTEVNYGLVGGPAAGVGAAGISTERQVGNVMRTFVLNAANRVSRVYWYSWDLLGMSNTPLVEADRITLTPAGQAFSTTRSWLLGARPVGCTRAKTNTWTCTFTTATQTRRIVWNPSRSTTVTAPLRTSSVTTWSAAASSARAGTKVRVGVVPVLISSRR
jgi:hypothetical protein